MRELHVYGSLVPVGKDAESEEWQHRNFGKMLIARAEEITSDAGFCLLAIMSGIGVRPYYRRLGYERNGPYMIKELA
jgi:elongator complex protein 3